MIYPIEMDEKFALSCLTLMQSKIRTFDLFRFWSCVQFRSETYRRMKHEVDRYSKCFELQIANIVREHSHNSQTKMFMCSIECIKMESYRSTVLEIYWHHMSSISLFRCCRSLFFSAMA